MAIAIAIAVLTLASLAFHFLSPWFYTPIASNWGQLDDTVTITLWVTGVVFVVVNLFMAYSIWKYRTRAGLQAEYVPERNQLEAWLMGLTTVGIAALLAPGLIVYARVIDVPKEASLVEVVGRQWNWSFRFPGPDGKLGTTAARYVNDKNMLGLNPDDPHGQDDVLIMSQELHLPEGKPIKFLLRSLDVLHDFSVPQFRVKMDLVPGMITHSWLTPTRTGTFDLLCENLCGLAHFAMRGKIVVEEPAKFETWLAGHQTFSQAMAEPAGDAAAGKQLYASCASCHGAAGEGNSALNAPKLAGQADWYLERTLSTFAKGARGADERDTYGKMMAPMAMALPDATARKNVVAYIKTLPDSTAPATIEGDTRKGHQFYQANCAACHGGAGEGIKAMNAPRLAGQSDWYIERQLTNFHKGIRGTDPEDSFGPQMVAMAGPLSDERQVKNLVAYIKSLGSK
ncbi:MAG: c-type cytochrome [Candidatus Sericytochromatia bacterium]|nr:c-type cytochrome [Candidatus Tanganyikabacteria bacterium]